MTGKNFASGYANLCGLLVLASIWNAPELKSRAEMEAEGPRTWALAALETIADDATIERSATIRKALSSDFTRSRIQLPPAAEPAFKQAAPAAGNAKAAAVGSNASERRLIVFAGDSLANGYAAGAARWLAESKSAFKSRDDGKISTGLVAKQYYDWERKAASICDDKPYAVVFSFGSNDPMDMKSSGGYLRFGTDSWKNEYGARASRIVEAAKACGAKVAWLGLPAMREKPMEEKIKAIRESQAQACEAADVCVEPFAGIGAPELSKTFQERAPVGGKNRLLRAQDGIHMAPDGYYFVAGQALEKLLGHQEN